MHYRLPIGLLLLLLISSYVACTRVEPVAPPSLSPEQKLLAAVEDDSFEKVRELLEGGKLKNVDRVGGKSLLQLTIDNLQPDVMTLLLEFKADPNFKIDTPQGKVSLLRYAYDRSLKDEVGYLTLIIGVLIDYGADLDDAGFEKGLFDEILENRVVKTVQRGDLLFTNWFSIMDTIFKSVCMDGSKLRQERLERCNGYLERVQAFSRSLQRDQEIATRVGDIDEFAKSFDLCPLDETKIAPGACGCGNSDADLNRNTKPDCLEKKPKV